MSNLQSVTHRYVLARYRNRIWNWSSTDMPWLDTGIESLNSSCRHALAGYRNRIYNQLLTDMPWLDTGVESLYSSCWHALARYKCRIHKQLLTDIPWLDTGIESGIGRYSVGGCNFQQVMKELLNTFDIRMPQVVMKETCPKFTELLRDLLKSWMDCPRLTELWKICWNLDWTAPC